MTIYRSTYKDQKTGRAKRPRAAAPVIPQATGATIGDLSTAAEISASPAKKAKQKRPKPQLPKRAAPLPTKGKK